MKCKNILLQGVLAIVLCFVVGTSLHSQTIDDPLVFYKDYQRKDVSGTKAFNYIEAIWKDGLLWRAQLIRYPELIIKETYWYTDSTRKVKQGLFKAYHDNAVLADSGWYEQGQLHGDYFQWHDDGTLNSEYHYNHGNFADTCVSWNREGDMDYISITDSAGNGICHAYIHPSGKPKFYGRLFNSRRQGKWLVKTESGQVKMEVYYEAGEEKNLICYDAAGQTVKGNCVLEKPAEFPGGAEGWRRFLEQELQYPEYAQTNNITGTVKVQFNVAKDGTVSDFKIRQSPHSSLSQEVLRLMRKSPKWQPAVQFNEPVVYRHVQNITFNLR